MSMGKICAMYLRKSRTDMQAEARGEGDPLDRHRRTLEEYATRAGIRVAEIYQEVASGDSIAARPEMQRLLMDVLKGRWEGVLCMDIDRLSRGAAGDQDTILRTFQASGTLIITPGQTYDLTNPGDQDSGEFRLFFSRFEYKAASRRLYRGRERSASDGWYIGARTPYGYRRVPAQGKNGPTLEIVPEQAEIVRRIFEDYAHGMSGNAIANALNAEGVKPNYADKWYADTIRNMLRNPLYIGRIRWAKKRSQMVSGPDGQPVRRRVDNPDAVDAPGRHPPIIAPELFDQVAGILSGHPAPRTDPYTLNNPLAGIVVCGRCGYTMQRKTANRTNPEMLYCTHHCGQASAPLHVVERMILAQIDARYAPIDPAALNAAAQDDPTARELKSIERDIAAAERQLSRQAEMLERGVYSVDYFLQRREEINKRLVRLRTRLEELRRRAAGEDAYQRAKAALGPSRTLVQAYGRAEAGDKNRLLKALIDRVVYDKAGRRYRVQPEDKGIELEVFFK